MAFFRLSFPPVLPSWAQILTFDAGNTTYAVNTSQYYLYVNTNGQDVMITLPANAEVSRAFNIRKINDSADILTLTTDDANCFIDGASTKDTNSILTSISLLMGLDGNYWSTTGGGGGGGVMSGNVDLTHYVNTAQLSANLALYETLAGLPANVAILTANSASYIGSLIAVNVVSNAQLTANLSAYQLISGMGSYQTTAGLSANVATLTANNTSYVGTVTAANVVSNAQLQGNIANFVNTAQLSGNLSLYQTTAGLSANVATLTANSASYVGSLIAVNVVSNAQLSANLAAYQTTAGMSAYQTTAGLPANVATLTANNTSYVGSVTAANVVSNAQLSGNLSNYQTTAGLAANVATLTANSASYVGSLIASNVVSNAQLSGNLSNYQTTAGLSANVATLTANNTSYVGTVTAANVVSNAQLSANLGNYQTSAGLNANVDAHLPSYTGLIAANGYNLTTVRGLIANSGLISNSTGAFVNLASTSGLTLSGGGIAVVAANGLSLTAAGLNVFQSNGIVSNSTGLFLIANTGITINSTGIFAPTAAGGTVTNVAPANGIMTSPNPITGAGNVYAVAGAGVVVNTGGINVLANNGIVSNSTGVFVNANNGIVSNSSGIFVNANTGITVNSSGVFGSGVPVGNSGIVSNATGVYANLGTGLSFVSGAITVSDVSGLTANNSSYLGGVAAASYINTSGNYVITGNHTFGNSTANLFINSTAIVVGNSSVNVTMNTTTFSGTSLTANNATNLGGVAASGYINTSGSYVITGVHTYGNSTANLVVNSIAIVLGNSSVNATMNTTTFSGIALTANNASYIGGLIASNVVSNAQLSANLANYQTTAGLAANVATLTANNSSYLGGVTAASYINTSGSYVITGVHTYGNATVNLVINSTAILVGAINSTAVGISIANNLITIGNSSVNVTANSTSFSGTANNALYIGGLIASNVVSNVQLSSNLSNYQTTAGLAANVATLTANSASYIGTLIASNVVSNAMLSANLANYQTTAGLNANIAAYLPNYTGAINGASIYIGGSTYSFHSNNTVLYVANSTANTLVVNNYISGNGFGLTSVSASVAGSNGLISNSSGIFLVPNTGVTVNTSGIFASSGAVQALDSIAGSFNGSTVTFNLAVATVAVTPSNPQNLIVSLDGVIQQPTTAYTVSGSTITFTTAPSTGQACFITMIGAASGGGVAGANTQIIYNSSGVYAGDANLTWTGSLLTIGNSSVNSTINSTSLSLLQTTAGLSANVATLTSNNTNYLSGLSPTKVQNLTCSTATANIDLSLGQYVILTLNATVTTMNITNWAAGSVEKLVLEVRNQGAFNITGWNSAKWAGGTLPTVTSGAGKYDVFVIHSGDNGTIKYGGIVGQNYS